MQKHTAKFLVVVSTLLSTLVLARSASADTIDLMWDQNPEPQVIGYVVHVGTQSGTYTQHIDVGPTTTWSFTSAVAGQQYCFAVTAYITGPLEGPRSNEVCGFSNAPPALVNPGTQSSMVGQSASLQLAGSDPKGDPLTYTATGLPPGLTVMASTGYVSGTPTTAGSYTVNARVSDGVLIASQTFTWTVGIVDTVAPVVTITGPTSASTYSTTGTTVALSGSASDNTGVTQVSWVNSRGGSGTAAGTTSWTVAGIGLQAGANVLTLTARDAAGNSSSDALTVTVNGPPAIASVANQSSVVGLATTLQLVGSDPNGDTLTYTATGLPAGLSVGPSSGLISGTPNVVGAYNVTVSVSDGALTASRAFTWAVTAGTSAPGTLRLMWDAVPDPRVLGYKVYVGTQPGVYGPPFDAGLTTVWTFTNPVAGQQHCFAVTAYIAGGIEGPKSSEVCGYSNQAPTLASVTNQTSNIGQSATLQLAGTDPDGMALTYSATGLPAGLSVAPSTGLISGAATTAGVFTVSASVSDGVLTASRTFTWTVIAPDSTAPSVAITGPTSAATYTTSSATITLSGTSSDNVGVTQVSWVNNRGGSGTATGTTSWSGSVALLSGSNVVTVTARDAAGNTSTDVLTVTYNAPDTTAPVVTITGPTSAATYATSSATITLSGTSSDNVGVTQVSWVNNRGGSGTATGKTSWSGSVALLSGSNVVTVTARDAAGNTSTDVLTVTYNAPDTAAPVVTITGPTSAATHTTSSATITLSGTSSDNVGVTQVSWVSNRGGSGTATGTTSWSGSVALLSGSNVVTVTARDAAGNTSTDVLTVTYNAPDTTAPVVTVASPTTASTFASTKSTVTLKGSASDNVGVSQVTWRNDRGGSGTATGTKSWSVTGVALQEGVNVLTVTARDAAGNTSSDVLTVTYTAPLRITSLTADRPAPQPLGTTVTFTAVGAGDTGPYQYQWRVYDGAKWVTASAWGTSNQFVWKPTKATSLYQVRAVVRSATLTTAMTTMPFAIVP